MTKIIVEKNELSMMETDNGDEVKIEPIDSDEGETELISRKDEEDEISTEKITNQLTKSKDVSPPRPPTPPYYTQNHNVGGKWKVAKEKKQYNCKTCKFKFTSKTWLIKHERMHENMENKAKMYKCEICRKEFTQRIIYHDHMAAHEGRKPYVCDRCGMEFTWYRAFYRHQQSHKTGGQEFSCHLCQRRFNSNWNLSRHLKEIHLSQQTFNCSFCGKIFEKKNLYQIHMKAHAREERDRKKKNGIVSEKVKQKHLKISKVVSAMVQSKSGNNNKGMTTEEGTMTCDDKITASEFMENITEDSGVKDRYSSSSDDDDDDNNDGELFHKVSHSQETDENCPAYTSGTIVEEVQRQEINSGLAKTSKTVRKQSLVSSQKQKPKACTCDICGKNVHNLDAHLRIHSGEKPFRCCLCDKDFAQREALKIHYRSHTGEKPFLCNICGKGFATRGLQQDHARAHKGDKPYQCDVCDARFSWRCALSRHKQLHSTGPKPHSCSVCTFECWRKHDLTKHEETHLHDNHYQCDFENCTAIFTNKKHFLKHKNKHKGPENSVSKMSPRNGRITRLQAKTTHDNTDQTESIKNQPTDKHVVEIKQEVVDDFVADERQTLEKTSDTPTMYIRSNDGQMQTVITNPTGGEETDPDSGKFRYVKGKRLHLNQDMQRLLSKKLNERKMAKLCTSDVGSSSDCLESKIEERTHSLRRQSSYDSEGKALQHGENQVTISINDVIEKNCQPSETCNRSTSNSNQVCCEVCGKTLNISYYHIHVRKHMEEMAHTCKICNKSFSRKPDLIVHSRVHTNIRPFQCTTCPKAFKVKSLLEDHIRSHDGIKPYVCSLCDASFAWRCAFHRHVKTHSIKKPFQCDVCGKDFRRRRDWSGHIKRKTCKFVKSIIYKCNECQAVFANLETLVYHNEKYHKETSPLNVLDTQTKSPPCFDNSSETSDVVDEQNKTDQTCPDESIHSDTDTTKAVISCPPFVASNKSIVPEGDDPERPNEGDDENKMDMPHAGILLSNLKIECVDSDFMISSNVNSTDSIKDSSTFSNTDFNNQSSIQPDPDHIGNNMVPSNKNASAAVNWTGENLKQEPSSVKESSQISGVTDNRLKCKLCGRCFVSSLGLKIHLRIHSKDAMDVYALHFRPDELMTKSKKEKEARKLKYKCEICDKTFPFASGLRVHMMTHSGKLPYDCKTCGKKFSFLGAVKSHMRVHSGELPFTCEVCGKSFAYRHNHDDHYRTHTGDKPYKCDRCDSAFTWKSALHRHHKTHNLETLEVCPICKAKFKSGGHLVRHMNRFHSSLI